MIAGFEDRLRQDLASAPFFDPVRLDAGAAVCANSTGCFTASVGALLISSINFSRAWGTSTGAVGFAAFTGCGLLGGAGGGAASSKYCQPNQPAAATTIRPSAMAGACFLFRAIFGRAILGSVSAISDSLCRGCFPWPTCDRAPRLPGADCKAIDCKAIGRVTELRLGRAPRKRQATARTAAVPPNAGIGQPVSA